MGVLEMGQAISDLGITVIIVAVFLINIYMDKREASRRDEEYRKTIVILSDSTNNVAKALDLLRQAETNTEILIRQHDERSIEIKQDVQDGFNCIKTDLIEVKTMLRK